MAKFKAKKLGSVQKKGSEFTENLREVVPLGSSSSDKAPEDTNKLQSSDRYPLQEPKRDKPARRSEATSNAWSTSIELTTPTPLTPAV